MQPVSVVCLFCEDIRQEKNEVNTLVGIMPDNMNLTKLPALLPKLGIYVRINIDPSIDPGAVSLELFVPGVDKPIPLSKIEPALINKARNDAIANGTPIAGIISRVVFSPFELRAPGRIRVQATIRGEPVTCGTLNIQLKSKPIASGVTSAS